MIDFAHVITKREMEVLTLVAYEYTTQEIAKHLYLSKHTIDTHKKNLKLKLDVRNTAGMVRKGFESGLLPTRVQVEFSIDRS